MSINTANFVSNIENETLGISCNEDNKLSNQNMIFNPTLENNDRELFPFAICNFTTWFGNI